MRTLSKGIATAPGASPPLAEAGHGRIMQRHIGLQSYDPPLLGPQSHAKLRLFASDETVAIAIDVLQSGSPHHDIATASESIAGRTIPLPIAELIVDRPIGKSFSPPAKYGGNVFVRF